MRKLILQVKSWISLLDFGPNQPLRPFTWRLTSGYDSGRFFYESSMYLHQMMNQWLESLLLTRLTRWSSPWSYPARHRDPTGTSQTRTGRIAIRAQREDAWHNWMAYLEMRTPSDIGIATFPATGDRAYRKLSPAILNRSTTDLIRRYSPEE